jgi:hypothetical protein
LPNRQPIAAVTVVSTPTPTPTPTTTANDAFGVLRRYRC